MNKLIFLMSFLAFPVLAVGANAQTDAEVDAALAGCYIYSEQFRPDPETVPCLTGRLPGADPSEIAARLERECARGAGSACTLLGRLEFGGWLGERDFVRAAELWTQGCDQNDAGACDMLGMAVEFETHPAPIHSAVSYYERACELGHGSACNTLGVRILSGIDPFNVEVAMGWYRRGCEHGEPLACANLSVIHDTGSYGVPVDRDLAWDLWARACQLDHPDC